MCICGACRVCGVCVYVCMLCMCMENIPPSSNISPILKRKNDIISYIQEEQQHVLKRLRLHHINPDGTLSFHSANHVDVTLLPLPTPHIGSHGCSSKTQQRRSKLHEKLVQHISTPSRLIKRNRDIVTTSADAAGLRIFHKLSGMINLML